MKFKAGDLLIDNTIHSYRFIIEVTEKSYIYYLWDKPDVDTNRYPYNDYYEFPYYVVDNNSILYTDIFRDI